MSKYSSLYLNKIAESINGEEKKSKSFKEKIKTFLRNVVTGTAAGAAIGGGAGYGLAGPIRDMTSGIPDIPGAAIAREIQNPLSNLRGVSIPMGIGSGAILGALGGATLPYLYSKSARQKFSDEKPSGFMTNMLKDMTPDIKKDLAPQATQADKKFQDAVNKLKDSHKSFKNTFGLK
jgi:hypothetical protein